MDIFIFANSPGEVWAWAKPTIEAILEREPDAKIFVVIPPCPYASGGEMRVVSQIPGLHRIIGSSEFARLTFLHPMPRRIRTSSEGIVVHMGGDMFNTALFATRLKLPAVAYAHRFMGWHGPYKRYMVPDERTRDRLVFRKVPPEMITVTGDLITDVVKPQLGQEEAKRLFDVTEGSKVVSLFPGSREYEIKYVLPFLLRVAEQIISGKEGIQPLISCSPFIELDTLAKAIDSKQVDLLRKDLDGSSGKIIEGGKWPLIVTEKGLKIPIVSGIQYDLMNISDLALASPGTTTAELAVMGVPMIVVAPLNRPEEIAIDGIMNYVGKIPVIGRQMKRNAVFNVAKKMKYVAIPNKKADKYLVPEFVGILDPPDIAYRAIEMLNDSSGRRKTSEALKNVMGKQGAAVRAAEIILEIAREVGVQDE